MPLKETLALWSFSLVKIPLLLVVRPSVVSLNKNRCEIKIPLNYWTRNHLKSMYFGALCIGADCGGGLLAMAIMREFQQKTVFIFKDFQADFLKRPEGDVHFICEDGPKIRKLIKQVIATKKRNHVTMNIVAKVPKVSDEPVARFKLTISLKVK